MPLATNPTINRVFTALSRVQTPKALATINTSPATARPHMWAQAVIDSPLHGVSAATPLVIDVDAGLVNYHW
ncbi:hypothetical protein [Arthrobacter sp. SDTb3-6]|uniref:hypothetical protein n=1 Tax=Arthrobacter sp. SDTb3-6 TaxID=2713571 RepID=UPI00159E1359|nr:hypothetical protein [Arthrobacter sp. SDTb3-6]NVN00098.1 hypothetical protein [Arthrobacter sp. SDTb3-6]